MMFDPPDYPYKELTDHLKDNYDADDLLFNSVSHDADKIDNLSISNSELVAVTEQLISNVENDLLYQSNDSGRYFNIENMNNLNLNTHNIENSNEQLCLVQSDNIFFYEPTLLDDNTVNQFLLPLQNSSDKDKDAESKGPDLLALHSCVICHEIFTSDADHLDHTISMHASVDTNDKNNGILLSNDSIADSKTEEVNNNKMDFEFDWLVCCLCERVLSTALEVEPTEQLCCRGNNGKGSVVSRKLHKMFVCDSCNGLFADADALDKHRLQCCPNQQQDYIEDDMARCSLDAWTPQCPEVCFSCETCGTQFSSTDQLKRHTLVCQRRAANRTTRRSYMNNTNNNKMWNCGSCNQLFVTARELYKHKRGEDRPPGSPIPAFICEECDKVLGSMCALHTHKKMHKVKKPGYPCRICGRRFNQSGHLAIHMRMHTGERPYPCDLCPKAFKVKVERDDHRRTHTGERPFACAACPKTFTAAARLREHARIHTDQRPYRCEICGAAFRRPYARTVHTLIHTGEKPHECDICGTAFRRSGDMWKHKRTLHGVQANATDGD
ncbi:unnamed protein product [Chilo suppressalis]|uniref:C2H2-type domain-containing protein n=1 Tax=Chilo suppressalis TaxID=168631 RepID=A0ABN8ECQ2_CHISP|nr:unnamed protein product [Chilo suppressalis]